MPTRRPWGLWLFVHLALLLPFALLLWDSSQDQLTANPIEEATRRTGKAALILLLLSLACSQAHKLVGFEPLLRLRRTLGLYAFAYATVHLIVFVWLDYGLDLELIREDMFEKRYSLAGLSAFVLLAALAITSTARLSRRWGRGWPLLRHAVYLAAALAVLHYLWEVRVDTSEPLRYGGVVLLLLLLRHPMFGEAARKWRAGLVSAGGRVLARWPRAR